MSSAFIRDYCRSHYPFHERDGLVADGEHLVGERSPRRVRRVVEVKERVHARVEVHELVGGRLVDESGAWEHGLALDLGVRAGLDAEDLEAHPRQLPQQ